MRAKSGEVEIGGTQVRWSLGADARHAGAVWQRFKSATVAHKIATDAKDYAAAADLLLEGMRTLCVDCLVGRTIDDLDDLDDDAVELLASAIIEAAKGAEASMGKAPATSGRSRPEEVTS